MFGIIFVCTCLFIGLVSLYYYRSAKIQEESKSDAELRLEAMLLEGMAGSQTADPTPRTEEEQVEALGPIGRLFSRPASFLQSRIPALQYGSQKNDLITWLDQQLLYAGMKKGANAITAEEVLSRILAFWLIMTTLVTVMVFGLGIPSLFGVVILLVVFIFPYVYINSRKRARQEKVFFELPMFMEDMISNLGVGSTGIDEALATIVEVNLTLPQRKRRILPEEFGQAFAEYRYAGRDRDEALRAIGARLGVDPVSDFIDLIIQGLQTGYPIRDILMKQSEQVQEIWKQEMRAYIGRKESAFVVSVGLIAIGVLVLVMTPLFLNIFTSLSGPT